MSDSLSLSDSSEEDVLKCIICSRDSVDAVLLNCLHSACRSCTESDVTTTVTCPACQDTTATPTGKTNLIVLSLANRSLVLKDAFSCTQCIDDNKPDSPAVAWCYSCQYSLCVDCQKFEKRLHATHKVIHLNECTNLSELYRPPARLCTEHKEEVKFACFTCKNGRCSQCAHNCYKSSHDVLPLDNTEALKRMNDNVKQATDLLVELKSALPRLQDHFNLPQKVLGAREESLDTLKKTKLTAIDSISSAYENAAESLRDCWDCLIEQSVSIREKAERLITRAQWTDKYCQLALKSSDGAALLPQLDEMLSSLRSRLEEARLFEEPMDPYNLVRHKTWLPSDLDLIASGWFGSAKVISDDINSPFTACPAEESVDYYNRKVSTLKELEILLQRQKEEQERIQQERQAMLNLQSEVIAKDAQLVTTQNELKKLLDQQKELREQFEREKATVMTLQSDLSSKTQQLDATKSEVKKLIDKQKEQQEQLDGERKTVAQLQSEVKSKTQLLAAKENEVKKLLEQHKEQQDQLARQRTTVQQQQSELTTKTQQLDATKSEVKKLLDKQKEQQEQLDRERKTVAQLQTEVKSKTQLLEPQRRLHERRKAASPTSSYDQLFNCSHTVKYEAPGWATTKTAAAAAAAAASAGCSWTTTPAASL